MSGPLARAVDTLTIRIPMRLQRRGGRKLIMAPDGAVMSTPKPRPDETLVKTLGARTYGVGRSRAVRRGRSPPCGAGGRHGRLCVPLFPLTCLAPDIVDVIPDGRQLPGLRLLRCWGTGGWPGRSSG